MYKRVLERQMRLFYLILFVLLFFGYFWIATLFLVFVYTAHHDEETLEEEAEYDDDALASYASFEYDNNVDQHDIYLMKHNSFYKKQNKNRIRI